MQRDHECASARHLVLVHLSVFFLRRVAVPCDLHFPQRLIPEEDGQAKSNVHVLYQQNDVKKQRAKEWNYVMRGSFVAGKAL